MDIQEGDYLIVDPACKVNERGTRGKNDGNEVVDDCDLPLDLELTERVEVDDETLPYTLSRYQYMILIGESYIRESCTPLYM